MRLKDQQVLITGAGRGIGLALAEECARRGAALHLVVRKPLPIQTKTRLTQLGAAHVIDYSVDLESPSAITKQLEFWREKKWAPDVLVNNAGQLTGGLLEKQSITKIYSMLQVNLGATIHLTHGLLPTMLERGSGVIVNNASVSGKMFFPCASTYAASKAGVVAFSESLRQEVLGAGIRVVVLITPGVKTDMFDEIAGAYGDNLDLNFLSAIPASTWAGQVCDAIENGQDSVGPKGTTNLALKLAVHAPKAFAFAVRSKFHRTK